jgi:hypothetical protein
MKAVNNSNSQLRLGNKFNYVLIHKQRGRAKWVLLTTCRKTLIIAFCFYERGKVLIIHGRVNRLALTSFFVLAPYLRKFELSNFSNYGVNYTDSEIE